MEKVTRTYNWPAVHQRLGQGVKSCLGRENPRDKKCEAWKHEPIGFKATDENRELLPNYKHVNWLIELKRNLWGGELQNT